ncbi:MAG: alpha-E domain-containing protein [Pseudomonadota bacterium]
MLGKTAGGLFWMFRYLERSENTARLIDTGLRMALTRSSGEDEWNSIITTAGVRPAFDEVHDEASMAHVVDFLLRDRSNPSSVVCILEAARSNARLVRTAITPEVWEATNECWMSVMDVLKRPVSAKDLPAVLGAIRQQSALVRGALHGTMLRNDVYNFARLGTFVERADNTARILDVKYYTLLPSAGAVGSRLDNAQWETILRSVSAHRSFRWLDEQEMSPRAIANFVIFDERLPRSLRFCWQKVTENLFQLDRTYAKRRDCYDTACQLTEDLQKLTIDEVFETGLHEFLDGFITDNIHLASQIERCYRFVE